MIEYIISYIFNFIEDTKMLNMFFLLFLSISPLILFAQSNVDKLVRNLDSLAMNSIDNWKISPDLRAYNPEGDPTHKGYNDAQWKNLRLDDRVYLDSCWIRKEIFLPEKILGKPVSGAIRLILEVDDYGYLWINGKSKGMFLWDGDFELTADAKPGEHFLIAIKAINTGGPLRLINAQIKPDKIIPICNKLSSLSLSLQVGQKLLGFDTYQTNARKKTDPCIDLSGMDRNEKIRLDSILQTTAENFNTDIIINGNSRELESYLTEIRNKLEPISEFAKRFTLFFDANAHIDASWLWRDKETIEVCNNTFGSVCNMMDARPDFTYTQSSATYYDWMEKIYPETFKKIVQRVNDGRWEITGGMWIEPDCNLIAGESWSRQLLYAKRYFREKFGVDVKIGWNPDSFGYNGNMPMFYQQAGIDAFITQKIGWNDTNVFPFRLFWWESADGSRILSYFPFDYVEEIKNPFRLVDQLRQFEANTGFTKMMVLFGVGDHGGGPSLDMMERIDQLRNLEIFPAIEYGTTGQYLSWLRQHDLTKLPVYKDELYLEYHRGTFTTQAEMKKLNRSSEILLTNAEKFSVLAALYNRPYNNSALADAWKNALFNQFHDILPGSGIHETYIDAKEKYDTVSTIATFELEQSLETLVKNINTANISDGIPVVIFNPLAWNRKDVVHVRLKKGDVNAYAVFDKNGNEISSQTITLNRLEREVVFITENIPSIGYTVYELRQQKPAKIKTTLESFDSHIENEFFSIHIDPETGWCSSIFDKKNNKELLKDPGNELQILEDRPTAWDAWNIGLTGVKFPSHFRKIECIEKGSVLTFLRVYHDYLKPGTKKDYPTEDFPTSFFTQDIILYPGIDRIDFITSVDWWENKTMLKVTFPLSVQDTMAFYGIPYGSIKRSAQSRDTWEKAKTEVPAIGWADVSNDGYGVSLLSNSKYGYDIKGNVMRLSLLRSPSWPDPAADRGKHRIEYALYPHKGDWQNAQTVHRAYEFSNPLIAVITDIHKGELEETYSFVQIEPNTVILNSIKKAEDGDDWVVQLYNTTGIDTTVSITLPRKVKHVWISNILEEEIDLINPKGNTIQFNIKEHAMATIKIGL
jgi:alpha-mannosidase